MRQTEIAPGYAATWRQPETSELHQLVLILQEKAIYFSFNKAGSCASEVKEIWKGVLLHLSVTFWYSEQLLSLAQLLQPRLGFLSFKDIFVKSFLQAFWWTWIWNQNGKAKKNINWGKKLQVFINRSTSTCHLWLQLIVFAKTSMNQTRLDRLEEKLCCKVIWSVQKHYQSAGFFFLILQILCLQRTISWLRDEQ